MIVIGVGMFCQVSGLRSQVHLRTYEILSHPPLHRPERSCARLVAPRRTETSEVNAGAQRITSTLRPTLITV